MCEEWRDIPGYDGVYQVSSDGRVRRSAGGRGAVCGRIITPKKRNGYLQLDLSVNDHKLRWQIHRLVALAFLGPPPSPDAVVNHIDGCKTNNATANLEWASYGENNRHAYATGLKAPTDTTGERNGRSKLTASQVAEIRSLRGHARQIDLANRYGVAKSTIWWIQSGRHWQ